MAIYRLKTPVPEKEIRRLEVKDILYISGTVVTARDQAHRRALELARRGERLPVNLEGLAVYHCGPLMRNQEGRWEAITAGPTTSARLEDYEGEFLRNFRPRIIIGKGGMGKKTTNAMMKYGAIYGAFTGGAAALAARAIKDVPSVVWLDLGMPEAMWVFEVEDFGPLTVAIDSGGNNLFTNVAELVETNKNEIYRKLDL